MMRESFVFARFADFVGEVNQSCWCFYLLSVTVLARLFSSNRVWQLKRYLFNASSMYLQNVTTYLYFITWKNCTNYPVNITAESFQITFANSIHETKCIP
ncbi:hypothetical protein H1P_1240019 [Hyella patelloides LEGE 07179]|uniref:Uncharacterized protein n=1 Tax=Hyella patelloides LEGE 07179 TaxID=945734 RepID=A0A563VKR4_9CYAN|nr:hypothetical protein H1P_1240019 [Hyella patelloides LEGE 07179]